MKAIPLTQGREALVDDADYEWLSQWKWCFLAALDGDVAHAYNKAAAAYFGDFACVN